jgi:tetratricopeptide (TPR) repeat protein
VGDSRSSTPADAAKSAYNSGVRSIKKAQEYESDAAKASNPDKSAKALGKAHEYYSKALELNPAYPEAIEYRGEAYLGLNKINEAKEAYMALFRESRRLPRSPWARELLGNSARPHFGRWFRRMNGTCRPASRLPWCRPMIRCPWPKWSLGGACFTTPASPRRAAMLAQAAIGPNLLSPTARLMRWAPPASR